ncbi:alpha/beta-hydrolase [Dichomitus squalens LYAD-421 SS1]|uniref:Carboxypeptidase n=1 Tax=Dichomitus squalens (strain LYAD-421) TaxID=732165 RepID=R7SVN7_DICSQ|nr:alpha/beta-hydrolase [Dichomitus squalens LYAD-421 SS1]EJF59037.1 alpha/beta-hydrolase [Dichomitus squalens LYAD-421 SS1]
MLGPSFAALLALVASFVSAQLPPTPSSWPQDYPGKPSGDFSPEWQSYFQVTGPLPNVTWALPRSFAGNIPVNRPDHPNNTLFFWAFEHENGSLTAGADERTDVPWGIWLNGGPGSSSLLGQAYENGPIHLTPEGLPIENAFSWDKLSDYIWIDQPVGVGWSTTDSEGYVHDEDEMGRDFMGFLENLVKVFPSLAQRPLYLTGESYAGTYIPYIMKTYFGLENPPVNIVKFAIGDGTVGSTLTFEYVPTLTTIETYPQLIGYDPEVFDYFREQQHLCGYDLNLTYPQNGHFPTLQVVNPTDPASPLITENFSNKRQFFRKTLTRLAVEADTLRKRDGELVKRDLSLRANGTIDSWYGCFIYDELIDYALNFSAPWSERETQGFDVYQVQDALNPESPIDGSSFYNDPQMVAALHAPTSKQWAGSIPYPFLGDPVNGFDPSVEPMAFLSDLASNASQHGISVVLYSGNDDSLVAHRGTEVVIQNTTFGGTQGFSRRPSTPWIDDNGFVGGVVHQERNWTYVLVEGAGHLIPYFNPSRASTVLREFILGSNKTGLVTMGPDGDIDVEGGEDVALAVDALPGQSGIAVGSITTTGTFFYPAATVAAWEVFIATATVLSPQITVPVVNAKGSGAAPVGGAAVAVLACIASFAVTLLASF